MRFRGRRPSALGASQIILLTDSGRIYESGGALKTESE
jgi:hypothetical protein